jgi:pilus assembly protein TadC
LYLWPSAALVIPGLALSLLLHNLALAVPLGAVGLLAPGWLRRRRYAARRRELLLELGDAVEYLELHFAAGAIVPDAIAGTAAFLVGPLAGELRRVLARAALLQDGSRALDELAQRLADPDLTAVARRLSAAWRLRAPGPDTFAGFGDTLRHIRETHIAARTKTLPVVYVAIAGWMLFALVAIIAVPVGTAFLHSLSSF